MTETQQDASTEQAHAAQEEHAHAAQEGHAPHAPSGGQAQSGGQAGSGEQSQTETPPAPPSEEELRAAYEAELNRITSADLIVQTAVSLLNIGGRRLGLAAGSEAERDLEQVRDAIDGVRGLMPVLERHMSAVQLRPLRDALAQLQMAFAREAKAKPQEGPAEKPAAQPGPPQSGSAQSDPAQQPAAPADAKKGPGPAEASGRLWVPGR